MSSTSNSVLAVSIKDKGALSAGYMPFINNGGLFVPTSKQYTLGDQVFILLKMLGAKKRFPVTGQVVWMTPAGAQGNKVPGVGVQFDDADQGKARAFIEDTLKGLNSSPPASTM